jgi:hypothetical protein
MLTRVGCQSSLNHRTGASFGDSVFFVVLSHAKTLGSLSATFRHRWALRLPHMLNFTVKLAPSTSSDTDNMGFFWDTYFHEAEDASDIPNSHLHISTTTAPFSDAVVESAHKTFEFEACGELEYSKGPADKYWKTSPLFLGL